MTIELDLIYYKLKIEINPFGDFMEEYFVFDVDGHLTGEVVATTEEEGKVLDELRRVTTINILDGYPASPMVGIVHYDWVG